MSALKILSSTYALDLTTEVSDPLEIVADSPTRAFRVALLNVGDGVAAVTFGQNSTDIIDAVLPVDSAPGAFTLPANMIFPMIVDCGAPNLYITGISSATNTLYITLVATE